MHAFEAWATSRWWADPSRPASVSGENRPEFKVTVATTLPQSSSTGSPRGERTTPTRLEVHHDTSAETNHSPSMSTWPPISPVSPAAVR